MPIEIKLERGVRGYNIVRKKCPNCDAELIFKIHKNEIHDVGGKDCSILKKMLFDAKSA